MTQDPANIWSAPKADFPCAAAITHTKVEPSKQEHNFYCYVAVFVKSALIKANKKGMTLI